MYSKSICFAAVVATMTYLARWPNPELDWKNVEDLAYNYSLQSGLAEGASSTSSLPLKNSKIIITGATSGIGRGLVKLTYKLGATIIAVGRSSTKLEGLKKEVEQSGDSRLFTVISEFNDLSSVSKAADEIKSKFSSIDFLINNAGIAISNETTVQGYDRVFGVNYLSPFLLTEKLLPLLVASKHNPKIVQVSSMGHWAAVISDLIPQGNEPPLASVLKHHKDPLYSYANSKLAQILHARYIAKQLIDMNQNVKVISIMPGLVNTNIVSKSEPMGEKIQAFMDLFGINADGAGLSSIINAMFMPNLGNIDSDYLWSTDTLIDYLIPTSALAEKLLLREAVFKFWVYYVSIFHRFLYTPRLIIGRTPPESFDITKQQKLYDWSKQAVSQWI